MVLSKRDRNAELKYMKIVGSFSITFFDSLEISYSYKTVGPRGTSLTSRSNILRYSTIVQIKNFKGNRLKRHVTM